MTCGLKAAAPLLTEFDNLQEHFVWVCDGNIKETVERKLVRELLLLEQYLLSQGQESVTKIISTYARDCALTVSESGSTYRWIGILRAAEKHWNTSTDYALFRTELEGINGSSPQLIFKTQDR
jgi:hypothetical protein